MSVPWGPMTETLLSFLAAAITSLQAAPVDGLATEPLPDGGAAVAPPQPASSAAPSTRRAPFNHVFMSLSDLQANEIQDIQDEMTLSTKARVTRRSTSRILLTPPARISSRVGANSASVRAW